ncbi:MAG: polysaccharide deacetylase family protein [Caldicoprobacterales bacterium]|jgi:peptidoglycan/xylan/chitin deacetylase (PgdA/CDA1 family)|nr:polysaccharide deacetylase family protein [Clostridiales bacterium]
MWWLFPLVLVAIFLIYCLLPSYWARNRSNGVFREGSGKEKEIYLTFDDGPNPDYTPRLLDILKENQVKATFFIMGRQARLYPDIVKRIAQEGHTIGCHSYSHRHAWLMPPITTFRDMTHTYKAISLASGVTPEWYRPPWGGFNLLSIAAARRLGLNIAFWSIEAQDWAQNTTAEHIFNTVVDKAVPGSVVVLHDNQGDPGAPENTLRALPRIIESLRKEGYSFVGLEKTKGVYHA